MTFDPLPPDDGRAYLGLAYHPPSSTLYTTTSTSILLIPHANTTTTTTNPIPLLTSNSLITISGYNLGDREEDLLSLSLGEVACTHLLYYNRTTIGCISGDPSLPSPLLPTHITVNIRSRGVNKGATTDMAATIRVLEGYRSPLVTAVVVEERGFVPQAIVVSSSSRSGSRGGGSTSLSLHY